MYPYLLRHVPITRVDQVWSTDITYVRLRSGFVYLVAIMDWYSRFVVEWDLSVTVDGQFCLDALTAALARRRPEIFNTDQGAQFTSDRFTGILRAAGVRISMDGRGRALDNVFVERLWRSVKYEEVYVKDYGSVADARAHLGRYFSFLQPGASPSIAGLPHASGRVRRGEGCVTVNRGTCSSSERCQSDPSAR